MNGSLTHLNLRNHKLIISVVYPKRIERIKIRFLNKKMLADESCSIRGSFDMKIKEVGDIEDKITEECTTQLHFDPSNFQENLATASDSDRNEFIDTVLKNSGIFEPGQTFINISTQSTFATASAMMTEPTSVSTQSYKDFTELEVYHSPGDQSTDIGINHEELEYIETELCRTTILTDPMDDNIHYEVENQLFSNFLKTNGRQVKGRKRKSEVEIRWMDSFWRKRKN